MNDSDDMDLDAFYARDNPADAIYHSLAGPGERLQRDGQRSGHAQTFGMPSVATGSFLGQVGTAGRGLFLEERHFDHAGPVPGDLIAALGSLFGPTHGDARARPGPQLVVLSSDDFQWFANNALAIQARNKFNANKTSDTLWYAEALPPDTMMYGLLADRKAAGTAVSGLLGAVKKRPYVQAGGNETVGHCWFAIHAAGDPRTRCCANVACARRPSVLPC